MIHKHLRQMDLNLLGGWHEISAAGRDFPVEVARHPRARRYVLRVTAEGRLRLTVPRGASITGGVRFAQRQRDWIAREWQRQETRVAEWQTGTEFWFRGDRVTLRAAGDTIAFASHALNVDHQRGVRAAVEAYLRERAAEELPARAGSLARDRAIPLVRVSVRNQRSRWGSCSPRGAIALNWRLIQMPPDVSDYVILHELAHRRHPNHSRRFWREVDVLCPWWRAAERWLRQHGRELL